MNKNQLFRKQQLTFIISNLVAFTLIFIVFGLIIFSVVQSTLYSQADKELNVFRDRIEQTADNDLFPKKESPDDRPPLKEKNQMNPRIIAIKWSKEGEIIPQEQMGLIFYNMYADDIIFDRTKVNAITQMNIANTYNYRSLLFENGDTYTQLLINVDSEESIIRNFEKILILCSIVALLLSITASLILSHKSMKPIIRSWKRQSDFVENASHELRTPLTIIQNKLELLLTTPNERIIDKFENIALSLSETRRLSKLTTDLLTLARADSTETQLVKEKVNIDELIREISSPYLELAELQNKHLELHLQAQMEVEVDKSRVHQLFVILLDNALKYTEEGDAITFRTAIEEQKVVISVSDTGVGISKEQQTYIFDRFYRADEARGRENGGAGLGLSIAHWIVSSHEGSIKVDSDGESGTTFTIKIPIE